MLRFDRTPLCHKLEAVSPKRQKIDKILTSNFLFHKNVPLRIRFIKIDFIKQYWNIRFYKKVTDFINKPLIL